MVKLTPLEIGKHALPGADWEERPDHMAVAFVAGYSIAVTYDRVSFYPSGDIESKTQEEAIEYIRNQVKILIKQMLHSLDYNAPDGYMCGVDFQHEAGAASRVSIYDSSETCKEARKCTDRCGIVHVALLELDWTKQQDLEISEQDLELE